MLSESRSQIVKLGCPLVLESTKGEWAQEANRCGQSPTERKQNQTRPKVAKRLALHESYIMFLIAPQSVSLVLRLLSWWRRAIIPPLGATLLWHHPALSLL